MVGTCVKEWFVAASRCRLERRGFPASRVRSVEPDVREWLSTELTRTDDRFPAIGIPHTVQDSGDRRTTYGN
ncbi:hypothetical protein C487_19598 [Natrinema pallidum DSM 3751]|uniref:Uncharacterized protein n=1 Tax=Natrinema pallidum DSM 3751 TaxID=1227495 RepID=L9YGL1_9EURY|nr:hypothetical protein C487_19598 [Natrinema pallidum DSM 3751]